MPYHLILCCLLNVNVCTELIVVLPRLTFLSSPLKVTASVSLLPRFQLPEV